MRGLLRRVTGRGAPRLVPSRVGPRGIEPFWTFGPFRFWPGTRDLERPDGAAARLPPQVAQLLSLLLTRGGDVVRREELFQELWGDRFVDHEQGLNFLVRQLRIALGDDASQPRYVETIRGTGYRFVAGADWVDPTADAAALAGRGVRRRTIGVFAATLILALLGLLGTVQRHGAQGGGAQKHGESASPTAFDLYAQGRVLEERGSVEDLQAALSRYSAGLAVEADLAEAWAGIAMVRQELGLRGAEEPLRSLAAAREAAKTALELAPDTARAHLALGVAALYLDLDPTSARRAFARAVELSPDWSTARLWLARATAASGEMEGAIEEVEAALRLDPSSADILLDRSWFYYLAGRYRQAAESARTALTVEPESWAGLESLHLSYLALGAVDAAAEVGERLAALLGAARPESPGVEARQEPGKAGRLVRLAGRYETACDSLVLERARLLALAGEVDTALDLIEAGLERRLWWSPYVGIDPAFDALRESPRYLEVVRHGAVPSEVT